MGCNQSTVLQSEIQDSSKKITDPIKIGDITLKNRMVMSPMTRCRADPITGIPNSLMKEYYTQRSGFGFIITECSPISPLSNAFPGAGGIYTEEQTEGWKKIVNSVHAQGSKICLQLWHSGRAVPKEFIGNQEPIAPSAIPISGPHMYTKQPHPVPREMTIQDIQEVKQQFKNGAKNAKKAGFDAIELHAANGYLVDQFLRSGSNVRKDQYGGSVENRCRFMLEVMDILIEEFGSQKVGIRFGLTGRYNDMYDENPLETYQYALQQLNQKNIAFVELKRHGLSDNINNQDNQNSGRLDKNGRILPNYQMNNYFAQLRPFYNGLIIGNDGFDPVSAQEAIDNGFVDLVAFASLAISNPDLVERVKNGWEINNNQDFSTYFQGGSKGYTDYPFYTK